MLPDRLKLEALIGQERSAQRYVDAEEVAEPKGLCCGASTGRGLPGLRRQLEKPPCPT